MRGPHDVANLGYIFGLNEEQGKSGVKLNPLNVAKVAAGRKIGPYRALIRKVEDLPEHEKWKVPVDSSSEESDNSETSISKDAKADAEMECAESSDASSEEEH